jgi:hypothetical protein
MNPAELMTAWRGIVPGFDATWHELSNVKATVNGSKAKTAGLGMPFKACLAAARCGGSR